MRTGARQTVPSGRGAGELPQPADTTAAAGVPRLSEPRHCCAEPAAGQFARIQGLA